jgi:hypothetical protein
VQLYRYFVRQSSEFCHHNPLCYFSMSVCCCYCLFHYRLSLDTFGYTLVCVYSHVQDMRGWEVLPLPHSPDLHTTWNKSAAPTVKVKVKFSLCFLFNWAPRHEGILGEWRYSSTHSLTSALDGGEWSASRPHCFTSRERDPGTHWIGGWVGPRAILDTVVKRKIPSP